MFAEHFEGLTDTQQAGKGKYSLLEIIVMTVCAVIAGCEVWGRHCRLLSGERGVVQRVANKV